MGILSAGKTDIGKKRKTNQDSIYLNPQKNFFIVADGMGGHSGGDIASALAVKSIPQYFEEKATQLEATPLLKGAVRFANESIFKKAQQNPVLKGMGTTVVMLYFKGSHAYIANVGDSRCYLLENNRLFQLSRDHSLVQEKMNMGLYTRAQAQADKMKNVLVRSVGFDPKLNVDVFSYKVARNDIFLICSDGLHGRVSDQNINDIIGHFIPDPSKATKQQLELATDALIEQANRNGGQDNISVILTLAQ